MASGYARIQRQIWEHGDIQNLSDRPKLLTLYLLSAPHSNALGCYRLPASYVAEDLHWPVSAVLHAIRELEVIEFIRYDHKAGWVFIIRHLKWNPAENPNQSKNLEKLFSLVPKGVSFYLELIKTLLDESAHFTEPFRKQLQEPLSKPFQNQKQEQEGFQKPLQEQEQKQEGGSGEKENGFKGKKEELVGRFGVFWSTYPRKEAKQNAWKEFQKLNPDDELVSAMISWIGLACASEQWQDKTKIPHPGTWLYQRRWEGDPPPAPKGNSNGNHHFGGPRFNPDNMPKDDPAKHEEIEETFNPTAGGPPYRRRLNPSLPYPGPLEGYLHRHFEPIKVSSVYDLGEWESRLNKWAGIEMEHE